MTVIKDMSKQRLKLQLGIEDEKMHKTRISKIPKNAILVDGAKKDELLEAIRKTLSKKEV
jgi:hypothetical protein